MRTIILTSFVAWAGISYQLRNPNGSLVTPSCEDGQIPMVVSGVWGCGTASGGGSLPTGAIVLFASGSCPAGYTEQSALSGKFLVGTTVAAGNVGTTGGADTITPEGENSGGAVSAHAGTAVADHASHTHTYNQVINHTHAVTSVGSAATGSTTNLTGASDTSSTTATAANPAGGVATGTTAGPSVTLTHSVTQPSNHTFTQPVFTGTQFDNRPAFSRVIACQKA